MTHSHLQRWANWNCPSRPEGNAAWDQVVFVRDTLTGIILRVYGGDCEYRDETRDTLCAISSHRSKSIHLPVYHMALPDGTECVLRDNFYDWKVSVKSPQPVECDFMDLFDETMEINPIYCEGFPKDWVFAPYAENKQAFTLELYGEYDVYLFFWILIRSLAKAKQAVAA